ncbi:MAG: ankyrin repeat domain-containing protein [Burkholderiaceae bacterium]
MQVFETSSRCKWSCISLALVLALGLSTTPAQAADPGLKDEPAQTSASEKDPRLMLLEAVLLDDARLVESLLAKGVDANARELERGPAVVMAATENSFAALAALLTAPKLDLEATNRNGETALMMAAFRGHNPSVEKLIARGAKVNRDGWTPLHYAAANGHSETMNLLIKAGADLDAESPNGTTAMMMAARMGYLTAYQELVLAGADPTRVNQSGLSAADYLERRGEADRAERLRRYASAFNARNKAK